MADYAIHDTTLIGTSNVIRKKEGSSALIDPADYPKRINLMGMLEEKTQASASVCTFDDGADDVPTDSVKITIPASLSGVSSVTETQTGRNLIENLKYQATSNRVNIGQSDDDGGFPISLRAGTYTLSVSSLINIRAYYRGSLDGSNTLINPTYSTSYSGTFTLSEDKDVRMWVIGQDDSVSTTDILTFQLEYGSTAHAYEPYTTPTTYTASLGRTIYGGEIDIVNGTGTDENGNDFTFTGQEVSTRLGYNAFWSDEGDTEVTYRASGTITPVPVVPTLISKTITENGTYDAEDDDADGYSEVTVNVSGVPSGDHDDPLGIMTDYTRFNVSNLYSAYYIGNGELKKEVVFQMASATGYEGFCISLDDLGLTNGTQYTLSFVLNVPTGVTFSGSYPWGIKYSSARVPASGSANTNTFNITPTVNFLEQTGSQNVSITFTAGQTNYLLVLLARIAGSNTSWITMRDVKIEEVSP